MRKTSIILEIASKAKASRAAVYAALNGTKPSTIGVSPEKREKILTIANELGYIRNELARSLVTGKTNTVGVLVHSLKNHFFTDFFNFLDDACYRDGYSLFIANSEFDADREARNLRAFMAKKIDALVIARDPAHQNDDLLAKMASQGIPIITLGELGRENLTYPNVVFDEAEGDRLAAEHLWSLGHREIAYLGAGKMPSSLRAIHELRWEKFSAAWRKLSGGPAPLLHNVMDETLGGHELAEMLAKMAGDKRPTAVACSMDRLAISLMSALKAHGLRVPQDISVIGYDDIDTAAQGAVPLTTIRLSTQKMAIAVWELLRKRLHGEGGYESAECVVIKPELVVRESTGKKRGR